MKKLILTIMAICVCLCIGLTLVSCDEPGNTDGTTDTTDTTTVENEDEDDDEVTTVGPDGISKEEWQDALAHNNFTNVTIYYTLQREDGAKQEHVVKINPDKVYRKVKMIDDGEEYTHDFCFTGEEGAVQAKAFIDIFLGLLAERDNFVYDFDAGIYNAPEEISVTAELGEGHTATETMKNGKVKFDAAGNLEYFTCDLTEAIKSGDVEYSSDSYAASWTFADYNKTVITEEEIGTDSPDSKPTDPDTVTTEPYSNEPSGPIDTPDVTPEIGEDMWNYAVADERFNNVTFTYGAEFLEGYTPGYHSGDYALDGDKMIAFGEYSDDVDYVKTVKEGILGTVLPMLKDYSAFAMDTSMEYYISPNDIQYEVVVMDQYNAKITVSDVVVWFNEDNLVSAISCKMTQEFVEENAAKKYVLDASFNFFDYGTTVVEQTEM